MVNEQINSTMEIICKMEAGLTQELLVLENKDYRKKGRIRSAGNSPVASRNRS